MKRTIGITENMIKKLCRFHIEKSLGKKLTGKVNVEFISDGVKVSWDEDSDKVFDKIY